MPMQSVGLRSYINESSILLAFIIYATYCRENKNFAFIFLRDFYLN